MLVMKIVGRKWYDARLRMSESFIEAEALFRKGRYLLDGSKIRTLSPDTIIATFKQM
jgi:hypothetical protein